jgi:hypothetical protein
MMERSLNNMTNKCKTTNIPELKTTLFSTTDMETNGNQKTQLNLKQKRKISSQPKYTSRIKNMRLLLNIPLKMIMILKNRMKKML